MVNNGASKACHACKKMHKKCDETRPFENDADLCRRGKSCLRCSRALRTCPGYEISKDRKFVNYIGAVDFNLLHQRHAGLLHQTPESTHLSTLDWPNIEKDARLAFFDDYCIVSLNQNLSRGYLNGLQTMIDRAGPNSELAQACTIIALVNLGKKLGNHTYIERAETLYSLLLRSFRLKISNEAIFTTLESMITAALLGLYEIITSTDAYPGAHVAHARGVSAILVGRFSPFDLMCGGKLFQVASPILLEDPEAKSPEPTPLQYSPTINKKVARRFSVLCTPLLNQSGSTIDLVYAQTEPLIRRAESMLGSETTIDQIRALKLEAEQLKEAYYMWPKTMPPEWTPRPVGTIVSIADEVSPDVGYWPCKVYSYYDLYVASIWNSYRKACLLVLNIIMSCNRRINGISDGLESDTSIQRDAAEHAEGIVSSIPYLLAADIQAFVENAASGSPPIVPGRPVGGLLSMYTFYVLSTLPMAGANLKVYLRRCLAWIGTRMSIGQATILSKCTNMDQFSYATEARVIIWTGMLI